MQFKEYGKSLLKNSTHQVDYEELQTKYDALYGKRFRDFAVLYCLKALLSPLVESLIALDRVIYIAENCGADTKCEIVEIFEKSKSTRNYLIYASK